MVVNIAIDVLVGSIPLIGDAFDIAWKANRRNYALMTRHLKQPRKHTWKDYAFLLASPWCCSRSSLCQWF